MQRQETNDITEAIIRLKIYTTNLSIIYNSESKERYVPSHNCCIKERITFDEKENIEKELISVNNLIDTLKKILNEGN
jgi:hypothetical protein